MKTTKNLYLLFFLPFIFKPSVSLFTNRRVQEEIWLTERQIDEAKEYFIIGFNWNEHWINGQTKLMAELQEKLHKLKDRFYRKEYEIFKKKYGII